MMRRKVRKSPRPLAGLVALGLFVTSLAVTAVEAGPLIRELLEKKSRELLEEKSREMTLPTSPTTTEPAAGKVSDTKERSLTPPTFRVERKNPVYVMESTLRDLDLSCKAKGSPKPEVTWFKDGENLHHTRRRFENYKFRPWKLHIANARVDDNGNYTCVVENEAGKVSRDFVVEVSEAVKREKPRVTAGLPGNRTVVPGDDLELRCDLEVYDPVNPVIIQWMYHLESESEDVNDETGKAKLKLLLLQDCGIDGTCRLSSNDSKYHIDDGRVRKIFVPLLATVRYEITQSNFLNIFRKVHT